MKKLKVIIACFCMAMFSATAFGDVAGSSAVVGSWTSTGVYSSTITLSDPGGETIITDVTVGVNIDHTWSSDVSMSLSDGTNTVVFNANQGDSSNYGSSTVGTYYWSDGGSPMDASGDSSFIIPQILPPGFNTDNPLNGAFASSDATWTLTVTDPVGGDGGVINGWNLNLTTIPEPGSVGLLGLVGSLALVRRRKR